MNIDNILGKATIDGEVNWPENSPMVCASRRGGGGKWVFQIVTANESGVLDPDEWRDEDLDALLLYLQKARDFCKEMNDLGGKEKA